MGKRREGREAAVQFLVYCDLNQGAGPSSAAEFWDLRPASKPIRDFALNLVEGVLAAPSANRRTHLEATPKTTNSAASPSWTATSCAWPFTRCSSGTTSRRSSPSTRPSRSPNASARRKARRFVNGILDRVKLDLTRPLRTAAPGKDEG